MANWTLKQPVFAPFYGRDARTARAVLHEVAQTKDRPLPRGLEPPVIAPPPAELASTPVSHVVLRLHGNGQEAQDGGPSRDRVHSGEFRHLQPDVSATQSRGDRSAPRSRAPGFQSDSGAGPSALQGIAKLQREQACQGTTSMGASSSHALPHAGELFGVPFAAAEPEIEAFSIQMLVARLMKKQDKYLVRIRPQGPPSEIMVDLAPMGPDGRKLPKDKGKGQKDDDA